MIGEVVSDRYRVTKLIASGGTSTVYLAEHVHMRKQVAIKVLETKAASEPDLVARFQREAIAGAHVQHPNIASATDFGQLPDGSYFLVLEYVPGRALKDLIAEGPVPATRAVAIARQIAMALGAAHEVGIVHRDVKPSNVLVLSGPESRAGYAPSSEVVKLIDFGFAKVTLSKVPSLVAPSEPPGPEKLLTAAGVVLGTVAYMAPEAALGMLAVDHRSDLYALGLILYELLTGKHPFDATEPVQLFLQQRTLPPPPFSVRAPNVPIPAALEAVVVRLLEKDPKDRYQSAAELLKALDMYLMVEAFEAVPEAPVVAAVQARSKDAFALALAKVPLLAGLAGRIPADGRFPGWAYLGLPAASIVIAAVLAVLASRVHRASPLPEAQAFAKAAPAEQVESAAAVLPQPAGSLEAREVPLEQNGLDAEAWRMSLSNAVRAKEWVKGAEAVLAIVKLDKAALREHDVQTSMFKVASALDQEGGERSDRFFAELAEQNGTDGLDALYEIARLKPWSKASKRAAETLRRPEVLSRCSNALRVLVQFREASCAGKSDLFGRMAEQGDERALSELKNLRDAECNRRRDPCCFKENRALGSAVHALKARLASEAASEKHPSEPRAAP